MASELEHTYREVAHSLYDGPLLTFDPEGRVDITPQGAWVQGWVYVADAEVEHHLIESET